LQDEELQEYGTKIKKYRMLSILTMKWKNGIPGGKPAGKIAKERFYM
jgi:hypothetical protein